MGRQIAKSVSLQNLPKEFRGSIDENYHDIDMVNAHPSILIQYCKKNDIKCENLDNYGNIILCNLENDFLLYSIQYFMKEGYKVDVLV